ncbi:hypothetical protein ABT093_13015 [Kitasatospora sp. NPDC002551]|uniref:hypothetical protein n=1 Tax=Kitasatospora sp. NPDC002551 TaxID=3154539 RepID=UPI00331AC828
MADESASGPSRPPASPMVVAERLKERVYATLTVMAVTLGPAQAEHRSGASAAVAVAASALSLIAMPAGYAVAAPAAEFLGMRTTLLTAAALIGTPCLLLNLLPGVRSVRTFPDGTIGIAGEGRGRPGSSADHAPISS